MGLATEVPSRLLSAFVAFALLCCLCVVLSCVGFVRLEFKLREQQDQIVALQKEIQACKRLNEQSEQTSRPSRRYGRDVSSKQNICHQCVKPWIREEIVSSVSYAVEAFCKPQSKLCLRGRAGPPGPRGEKGDAGVDGNISYNKQREEIPREERRGAINAPGIRVEPAALIVNEKSPATFSCFSTVAGKGSIIWDKIGGFQPGNKLFEIKDGNLRITSVRIEDAGRYMCTVESPAGLARAVVKLIVRSSPRISIKRGPLYALRGENVTLPRCKATGYPPPVVSWFKVSDRMPEAGRTITSDDTMALLKVRRSDSGIYQCAAKNSLGSAQKITFLVVLVKPRFTVRPPRKLRRFAGSSLVINCSANSNPSAVISWEHCEGGPISKRFIVSGGTLTIKYLKSADSGMYACVATSTPLIARAPFEMKVKLAQDCATLYASGVREDGVYKINPDNKAPMDVYCDMTTDGGGWTVFQKRYDGSVNFFRNWKEYKSGFGKLNGEFWLGNAKIYRLITAHPRELRVDIEDWEGNTAYAKYGVFEILDEKSSYKLNIGTYSGTAGDSLSYSNGMAFTTLDCDNDQSKEVNCAVTSIGAWWYKYCHDSNLNGQFVKSERNPQGMLWYFWKNNESTIKKSQMKIRPRDSKLYKT